MKALTASLALVLAATMATAQDTPAAHAAHAGPQLPPVPSRDASPAFPGARVLTITAVDYAFEAPEQVPAGLTEIRLFNRGPELHHVWLVKLEDGKTMADLFQAVSTAGHPPAWARDMGGPNAPAPGEWSDATVDLTPGSYVILCVIPSPDGKMHLMKGMARQLTVTPASDAKAAKGTPKADVIMTLTDYDFTLSKPLERGRQTIQVKNVATQPHEVFVARLAPGKTAQELLGWIEKPEGPPPAHPLGGTTGMASGIENFLTYDLQPGEYALICFIPDAKDRKPHFAHGMIKQVTVLETAKGAAPTGR